MLRNVASQKYRVYAWNVTTGLPATGDAANIAGYITKDDGTPAGTNDAAPTEADATNEPGYYDFELTQAETDAAKLSLSPKSGTSNIQVVACPPVIYTRPQYFSLLGIESDGDLTKVNTLHGHTAQTADHTAAIADIPTVAEFEARTLEAADYFDPATDAVANVTLVDITTTNTDMRGTDSALTSLGSNAPAGWLNTAAFADGAMTAAKFASGAFDAVWSVATRVLTAGTNIALAKGTGVTGFNDLSAAEVNAEADTAISDAGLATASALATVGGNVIAVKAVTDVLTAAAAAKLATSAGTIVTGTVSTATTSPTTTVFAADDITEATADHFNGRIVIFTSGVLANQATDITDYELDTGEGKFTVTALTESPSNDDTFVIV